MSALLGIAVMVVVLAVLAAAPLLLLLHVAGNADRAVRRDADTGTPAG